MESNWIEYKCKSGKMMFIYNKVTGVHKWPVEYNKGSSEGSIMHGQPVKCKELRSIATQTDDYGCNNGCTSMYINTDPQHVSNISETLPQQPQPHPCVGLVDEEHALDEHDPENASDLEDKDEEQQIPNGNEIFSIPSMLEKDQFYPSYNLAKSKRKSNDDSAHDNNVKKKKFLEREGCSSQTKEESLKCSYCAKQFRNKSTLVCHLRKHTGERPFQCTFCQKKFGQNWDLTKHLRTHTGEKPFECSVCKKKFAQMGDLRKHDRRIHLGEKPFECSICRKKFAQNGALTQHLRVHTGERPFECSFCKNLFARKGDLKKHCLRKHTGEKLL